MNAQPIPPDLKKQFEDAENNAIAQCDASLQPLLLHRVWLQDRLLILQAQIQAAKNPAYTGQLPTFDPGAATAQSEAQAEFNRAEAELKKCEAQIRATDQGQAYLDWEEQLRAVFESRTGSFSAVPSFPQPMTGAWASDLPPDHPSGPQRRPTPGPGYGNRRGPGTGGVGPAYPVSDYPTGASTGQFRRQPGPPPGARQGNPGGRPMASPPPVRRQAGPPRPLLPGYPTGSQPVPPGMRPRNGPRDDGRKSHQPPRGNRQQPRGNQRQLATRQQARIIPPGAGSPAVRGTGGGGRRVLILIVSAVAIVISAALMLTRVSSGGSGYGASVDTVKGYVDQACQNKNTAWPGDVQFACSAQGKNILWVFALMSSNSNPDYVGKPALTGQRVGLLPVPSAQAAQLYAPALGLNHVYDPKNPIDSLEVGALILNTDVGGTVNFGGVQGLESSSNNCVRYTGSAAQTTIGSGKKKLTICAQNLTPQGQQSLVEDLWLRWDIPGSSKDPKQEAALQKEASTAAQCAAVLYSSPNSPNANAQAALTWIAGEHQKGKLLV